MCWTVYCHTNKVNGKRYVGITKQDPLARWSNGYGYRSQMFFKAIEKYGWEEFSHEILYTGLGEKEAKEKERHLIAKWKTNNPNYGYNVTEGGDGTVGYKHKELSKIKMREAHKGKRMSSHTKIKMSKAATGKKKSEETKAKMREYAKNRSKEHKEKLGAFDVRPVLCVETNTIYTTLTEAQRATGIDHSNISAVCRGKRQTTGGYHWRYVT